MFAVVLAIAVLSAAGVTGVALAGHGAHRVVASVSGLQPSPVPAAQAPATTTWAAPATVPTTAVPTTAPPTTAPPSTVGYTPLATTTTAPPPPTSPPTTAAREPSPTVVTAASLSVSPSQANFPATPPPYWPMPILAVTVTNTSGVAVRSVVVHPVGVYSVPSSTCSTLMPGQSCVAKVQFCPTSPNHYLNTLVVTGENAATGSPLRASITLNGTAT